MSNEDKSEKKHKTVYTIVQRDGMLKKQWVKIGVAFINHDQSLNVLLDAVPTNGQLHIRDAEPYDPNRTRRNGNPNVGVDPFANERVIS
jgi:hypothetical protein